MKKLIVYRSINITLAVLYVAFMFWVYLSPDFNLGLDEMWFYTISITIGLSMLFKAIIFKSDSSLYLFVALVMIGLLFMYIDYNDIPFTQYYPYMFIIPTLASFAVGLIFKQLIHLQLIYVFVIISIPLYMLRYNVVNVWLYVLLQIAGIVLAIVGARLIAKLWYNNKK